MMKNSRFKYSIKAVIAFVASVTFASCTGNFEELNMQPTDVYPEQLPTTAKVGILFPKMIYLLNPAQENQNQHTEQMVGGQYGGYFATTNPWQGTNFGTFNPSLGWVDVPFTDLFAAFYPNYLEVRKETGGKGYVYALANIIRVGVMQRVADIYGPIPYSQMGKGEFQVAYDDVQTLYHEMIDDLSASVNTLTVFMQANAGKPLAISDFDILYKGDLSKWIKYANSLKFRMAVRIAGVDTDYAKQKMQEAISGGVIESNSDNAFYATNDNPYRKSAVDWKDLAINATLSAYMSGYNDPRIDFYMTKPMLGYTGVRMGIENINKNTYGSMYSKPVFVQDSPMPIFYAAETYFLKAEAALQGWIAGGDAVAKGYYEQGIQTSMEQYGATIGTYLTSIVVPTGYTNMMASAHNFNFTNAPSVSWDDGTNKLEKIITQKWIANYPLGIEAWSDFRRTGYPQIITAVNNLSDVSSIGSIDSQRMVRRLIYPTSERDGNTAHVQEAIGMLGGPDTGATDLWWAKKN